MDLITLAVANKFAKAYTDSQIGNVDFQNMSYYYCSSGEYNSSTGVPTIASPDINTFYIAPVVNNTGVYNIYIYKNNSWVLFHTCTLDLSELNSEITSIKQDLSDIGELMPSTLVVLSDDEMIVNTGKRWYTDGSLVDAVYGVAISFSVTPGQKYLVSGRTNVSSTWAVRWELSGGSVISESTYDVTQPLADREFVVPNNAVKAMFSFEYPSNNPYTIKRSENVECIGNSELDNAILDNQYNIELETAKATINDFLWSANGLLPIDYNKLTNGYLNADGSMHVQTASTLEVTTDYIDIPEASNVKVLSETQNNAWLRVAVYDDNKDLIRVVGSNSGGTIATLTFIAQYNAKYMRVSYRSYGNKYACRAYRINSYNIGNSLYVEKNAGYIGDNGAIMPQDNTRKEYYTGFYPLGRNVSIDIFLSIETSAQLWCGYALFDNNFNFLSRAPLIELAGYGGAYSLTTEQIETMMNNGASYIAFSYRSYGDHGFYVCTNNKTFFTQNQYDKVVEEKSQWASFVKSTNHRGYNAVAPENTLPAYRLSKKMGFECAECDVSFTSDGVPVLLHDLTINRTGRNSDGSTISETINISSITYSQALTYDFGVWKGQEYAGTNIPTLKQLVALCKKIGLHLYIELKADGALESLVQRCVDVVNEYDMLKNVTWISFSYLVLGFVKNYAPKARLGYVVMDGISSSTISTALNMKTGDNEVFINSQTYTTEEVELCANANLPLEIWTINSVQDILAIDPYISGVASDTLIAGKTLYESEINDN